jgi:hypothetical protein
MCDRVLEWQYPAWQLAIVIIHGVGFCEVMCVGSVCFVLPSGLLPIMFNLMFKAT